MSRATNPLAGYDDLLADVVRVIDDAWRASARSVNAVMTATYWLVGRCIVELEQSGAVRADHGDTLLRRLSADLNARFGRGISVDNLKTTRGSSRRIRRPRVPRRWALLAGLEWLRREAGVATRPRSPATAMTAQRGRGALRAGPERARY